MEQKNLSDSFLSRKWFLSFLKLLENHSNQLTAVLEASFLVVYGHTTKIDDVVYFSKFVWQFLWTCFTVCVCKISDIIDKHLGLFFSRQCISLYVF